MAVAKWNFPHIQHIGDVCNVDPNDYLDTDLMFGGSPCQSFSIAGKKTGMTTNDGQIVDSLGKYLLLKSMGYGYDKSSLTYFNSSCIFWEFIRVYRAIKAVNPNVKFLLENVVNTQWEKFITRELGVEPIRINSSIFVPQNRDRYYWTDIMYIPMRTNHYPPKLSTIIPDAISGAGSRGVAQKNWVKTPDNPFKYKQKLTVRKDGIANCLTASAGITCRKYLSETGEIKVINIDQAEQLQGFPVGFTAAPGVSEYQRFKMLGNGWTIDVIAYFFQCLKFEIERKEQVLDFKS
jgi:site-specific DNA-cytosine methylase